MRINSVDYNHVTPTFNANVEKKFIDDARRYCINHGKGVDLKLFNNLLEKIKFYGQNDSVIFTATLNNEHYLILKNLKLNKKQGAIISSNPKFIGIIKSFCNLTDSRISQLEESLKIK